MENVLKLRNKMRVIMLAVLTAFMLSGGAVMAAVNIDSENSVTGSASINENDFDVESDVELDVVNVADADNDATVDVDTGNNTVNENTTVGDLQGGDIDIEGLFENMLNTGEVSLADMEFGDVDASFSNDTTGANSTNENDLDVEMDVEVDVTNTATIDNDVTATLNTGSNTTSQNTTVGDVESGNISMMVDVVNEANMSAGMVELPSMGGNDVSVDLSNGTTGANSTNENDVDIENDIEVDVTNTGTVANTVDFDADSGNNTTSQNTTVGDVRTGSVNISFSSINSVN